jgi:hypothetical protein
MTVIHSGWLYTVCTVVYLSSMNTKETKVLLKKNNLKFTSFISWMHGQAYALVDGEPDYYGYDVERFIRRHRCRCDCRFAPVEYDKCECVCHVRS